MGKYQRVREVIRMVLQDGRAHTAEELQCVCEREGIEISRNRAEIYNTVHQLKVKGEIVSDEENRYMQVNNVGHDSLEKKRVKALEKSRDVKEKLFAKIDMTDFEVVKPAIRKEPKQVVSVFDNGDLAINGPLSKVLKANRVEVYIKKDCSQILLVPGGTILLDITKGNRIKNYRIYEKLKAKKVKFPVYYVGVWDEVEGVWLGDLAMANPNKTTGKIIK